MIVKGIVLVANFRLQFWQEATSTRVDSMAFADVSRPFTSLQTVRNLCPNTFGLERV